MKGLRIERSPPVSIHCSKHFSWVTAGRELGLPPPWFVNTQVTYNFQNVLMGTFLTCKYREGEGIFRSVFVITLAILKERITREATTRKQQIGIAVDVADHSVSLFLFPSLLDACVVAPVTSQRSIRLSQWGLGAYARCSH